MKASGVEVEPALSGATVTMRFMTPMPEPGAARRTMLPDGACVWEGSLQVEPAAQRAVIRVTVTLRDAKTRSVQPWPLPRPSAIVTGASTDPAAVALTGAATALSLPGTKVSFTMIVPAHAGVASMRAAKAERRTRRSITLILRHLRAADHPRGTTPCVPDPGDAALPNAA
jgi:hypothetical protein